ncbi:hypothetical protein KX928_22825 [Roseobacter sp. YSTF-M11]|uniref:Uncharacterized protein n=1 Tax=Roseobacter insulae TaxID=2859783 RepID=A0A9X1G142_9RHOB|nr:hypothetical protein [Roseobacter insulae]MBW4710633.1 hypothetical protein [Roseobacter insulae]
MPAFAKNMSVIFFTLFGFCQKPARMIGQFQCQQEANARNALSRNEPMKTNTRFIKSITEAAAASDTVMPWARGKRRAAFIAKRAEADKEARKTG